MQQQKGKLTFFYGVPEASNYPTHAKSIKALGPKVKREKKIIVLFRGKNRKYIEKIIGDQYSIWTPRPDQTIDIS